ncbi:T cell receptor alpha chain MC.7.G5 [Osmerus mordax]|uniref:T cell receptor alpha chain MC.7.G5 n=1 Tax=Osmerus mordax TaxID=8014 RepID=UPI00350FC6D6
MIKCLVTGFCSGPSHSVFPRTFGIGISLTVNPNDRSPIAPSLSILTPLSGDAEEVCLATGFFPKDGQMQLTLRDATNVSLHTKKAVMSFSAKSYYFAGFSSKSIQSCSMNGITVEKKYDEPVETLPATVETIASSCTVETIADEIEYADFIMKINFSSILVNGLRVVFAKAVAFNVLLTVKVLVF